MNNLIDFESFSLNESYTGHINKDVTYKPGKSLGVYNVYDKGKFVKSVTSKELRQMKKAHSRFSKNYIKAKKK